MSWRHHAACRDADPELFFPTGSSEPAQVQAAEAIAVCESCPVIDLCREWALNTRQDCGIWGGLTEQKRRSLRRRRARAQPASTGAAFQIRSR